MILPAALYIISGITIYTKQTVWQGESDCSRATFDLQANLHHWSAIVIAETKHNAEKAQFSYPQ